MSKLFLYAKKLVGWYIKSWLFLLWSAFCISLGAIWTLYILANHFNISLYELM
jgi:hypothetical protein